MISIFTPSINSFNLVSLMALAEHLVYALIKQLAPSDKELSREVEEQVEIHIKYEGYINKELQQVERMKKMEDKKIPHDIDYDAIHGLANEAVDNLKKVHPLTLAQASRIPGVNPADISILLVYLEQGKIARIPNEKTVG